MSDLIGWLLDIYPGKGRGAVVWLLGEDGLRHKLWQPFPVIFYAAGQAHRLRQLWQMLQQRYPHVHLARTERRELFSGKITVLSIQVDDPTEQPLIFAQTRRAFPDLHYYNADLLFALRYTAQTGAFPLARCHITTRQEEITAILPLDSPGEIEPEMPPFRLLTLTPDTDPDYVAPDTVLLEFGDEQRKLSLHNPALFVRRMGKLIEAYDPDIILSKWGDTWLFPTLLAWSEQYHLPFNPNRDPDQCVIRRKGFSYHTYGHILHRGEQVQLFGRWHIDQTNAVMYGEYQLLGVIEQARMTGLPIQETARKSPGAGITAMQIITALRKGILVPYQKQQVETFKTPAQLVAADRGGLVGQPLSGVHYQVAGIDFFSMYPQIMARFNISPETMWVESEHHLCVPGSNVPIDQSQTGFIGQTLQALLIKRHAFKDQLAALHPLDMRRGGFEVRVKALKWLLVVCFGYLGHKHFRWMKIEAHEAVTAFGREALLQAKETAEQHGFCVLYFNVDGLYVQKQGANQPEDFRELLAAIEARTGLLIALDGIFRWIVFLPSRTNPRVPVANRYFGMFDHGKIKVRGIEMRRHDTSPFVYQTQASLLKLLAQVEEGQPLESAIPAALKLLQRQAERLRSSKVIWDDLIVTQRISRELSQYKAPSPAARAAGQLATLNKPAQPGQTVHFLFIKNKPGVLAWRAGMPFDYQIIDIEQYLRLMVRGAGNILQPLGVQERTLTDLLGVSGQFTLVWEAKTLIQQIDLPGVAVEQQEKTILQPIPRRKILPPVNVPVAPDRAR